MTYKGIVKGKTIEFEAPLALPEGTEVEVVVHVPPKQALASSSDPKGSGQALLRLWDTPAQCTPEDVDRLLQAIDQGKRPVRAVVGRSGRAAPRLFRVFPVCSPPGAAATR